VSVASDQAPRPAARENLSKDELVKQVASLAPLVTGVLTRSMIERLLAARNFEDAVRTILDDIIALHGSEYGNLQLASGGDLVIVAHRGFKLPLLAAFRRVNKDHYSACGRAFRLGHQIVIHDVEADEGFAQLRKIAREAGFRAVQSTPLITSAGTVLGVVSTHFTRPHTPSFIEIQTLKEYGAAACDFAYSFLKDGELGVRAEQMSAKLYAGFL
jgi:GAF domain-containing protein